MSEIFNIQLESDLSEFTSTVTDGGDLSWSSGAAMGGSSGGMAALIDDTTGIYGRKDFTVLTSTEYRFRFYFDPNGISGVGGWGMYLGGAFRSSTDLHCSILLDTSGANYVIRARYQHDGGYANSSDVIITDAPHYIEVHVEYASGVSGNDGQITIYVDGTQETQVTGIDLWDLSKPLSSRLGPWSMDTGTSPSGTMYFDEFILRDDGTTIGPLPLGVTVSDSVSVSENVNLSISAAGALSISVSETVSVSESVDVYTADPGLVFEIRHEVLDLSEYDSTVTDGGDLSRDAAAALASTSGGLQAVIDDTNGIYGRKNFTQLTSSEYRYRFYVDPNSLSGVGGWGMYLGGVFRSSTALSSGVILDYSSPNFQIRVRYEYDGGYTNTSTVNITDAPHYIEVHVQFASGPTANDGVITVYIDGSQEAQDTGLDMYDIGKPLHARLGPWSMDTGTSPSGTLYLDEFVLRSDGTEIGPYEVENLTISASDAVSVSDSASVFAPGIAFGISVSESISVTDSPSLIAEGSAFLISVSDGVSVTDSASVFTDEGAFFVDPDATDDNGTGSIIDPWKYISTHINSLDPGETMFLRGNIGSQKLYDESQITITASGTSGNPITIKPYADEEVHIRRNGTGKVFQIDGDYIVIDGKEIDQMFIDKNDTDGLVIDINGSYCQFLNFEAGNIYGSGSWGILFMDDTSVGCYFYNLELHDAFRTNTTDAGGIGTDGGSQFTISYCTIYDCAGDCIIIDDDAAVGYGWTIEYCELYTTLGKASENAIDAKWNTSSGRATIRYNVCHGFYACDGTIGGSGDPGGEAISIHNSCDYVDCYGNTVYDCTCGIGTTDYVTGITIYQNVIYNLHDDIEDPVASNLTAIEIMSWDTDVWNNTVYDAPYHSIEFNGVSISDVVFQNNIFHTCGTIRNESYSGWSASYNCWYNCTETLSGTGDVTSDPEFVNAAGGDFRLGGTSPCIDAGTDVGLPYVGPAPDMGAFEMEYAASISESISVSEAINVVVVAAAGDLNIVAQDYIGASDDCIALLANALGVGVSESISTSENASATLESSYVLEVSVSDSIAAGESATLYISEYFGDIDDSVVVGEFVELLLSGAGIGAATLIQGAEVRVMGAEVRMNG